MFESKTKENPVLFVTKWNIQSENIVEVMKRFVTSDPSKEFPEGVRLVGRWHNPAATSGVAVIDADSFESAMRWTLKWNDLMDITLEPVIEDEQVGPMAAERLAFLDEN
ncbi:MAG: DUF3303 domain-containing protein [SAR202 cluster bacterium]|jgi:hypothetical protein|nr:MAG: DUF3303 domain-containing protein [SAR202 cluster bacterium]